MPLVYCRACGQKISEAASECPHCGDPIVQNRSIWERSEIAGVWASAVTGTLVLIGLIFDPPYVAALGLLFLPIALVVWGVGYAGKRWL